MSVNATGSFLIGREAVRHLKKNGVGVFVTVSSLAGLYHRVLGQRVSYSASKAVQTAVMATADAEFTEQSGRKGPRAFVVCPGLVKDTPMVQNWLKEHPEAADQGITAEAAAEAIYGLTSKSQDWDYFAYELGPDGLTRAEPTYT
jgi:NAD(P)-dependent dehydrogenase (short-subunit alcohol dehydrogenase family)